MGTGRRRRLPAGARSLLRIGKRPDDLERPGARPLDVDDGYRRDALATARAVETQLADARGIFTNLQAENDIAEPLVEAMLGLSSSQGDGAQSARTWLLRNAAVAVGAPRQFRRHVRRFFDGPAPQAPATAWQTSGGLALAIAAAAVDSDGALPAASGWPAAASRGRTSKRRRCQR